MLFRSCRSLQLLFLLSVATMTCLTVWEFTNAPPYAVIPSRPAPLHPPPARIPLPRASTGPVGPQVLTPRAAPPVSTAAQRSAALARQAARQRYLNNLYLLARLIHGEARGEPYMGQVAVGAVVVNRTENPLFPPTVAGVIYEPGAFDAVIDGQIELPPDQEAVRAAQDAISGWDPTSGALYYYNPIKTTSYWIWSRTVVVVIGDHYFAR